MLKVSLKDIEYIWEFYKLHLLQEGKKILYLRHVLQGHDLIQWKNITVLEWEKTCLKTAQGKQ